MNRRIVLIDQEETPGYMSYYGSGLGNEIYTLQFLWSLDDERLKKILTIGEGDAVLLVGGEPFKYLRQFYHFGVRSENYFDCTKLYRLSIDGGAFVRVINEFPDELSISQFMSPSFTKKIEFPEFRQKVIKTYQETLKFYEYIDSLPLDCYLGFDYEGSGMPLDKWFELSGFSISTETVAGFVSLTDIRHQVGYGSPEYQYVLGKLGEILKKRMDHIVVYNMQYEFQASNRMLGVDLYNLVDASVVNIMDGEHEKKYSLKWTAQRVLGVSVWDAEFDRISDLIDSMLFTIEGKLKRDQHKVLKVDQTSFENTQEWNELCKRYPNYVQEFKSLLLEYWGNAFMCIPSDILGYYCNLDAFYTLKIFKKRENQYSKDCWQVNLDNTRLGCRLMSSGLYIDEPFRARYENYCHKMMAWGITYCAQARCWWKMEKHKGLASNLKRYTPVAQKLLKENQFYRGDGVEIVKNLMANNLDKMDAYSTGLDEGGLSLKYGDDFAGKFIDIVKSAMTEVKMKGKIDDSIVRKKKILGIIAENAGPLFGLNKLKYGDKHIELEKYLYYERAFNELSKVRSKQLVDINNIPEFIYFEKKKMTLIEYSDYISESYFKCKSPQENDEIVYDLTKLYLPQSAFLAAMMESTQQLPETDKFYSSRGISDINVAYSEFMNEWKNYVVNSTPDYLPQSIYPEKVFILAMSHYKSPQAKKNKTVTKSGKFEVVYSCSDKVKEIWTDFNGFTAQTQFFPDMNSQFLEYEKPFDPDEMTRDPFFFMRKMVINYLLYKKYAKLCSTYVGSDGMFKKNNRFVIENENHIPIRYADQNEPGAIEKCFVKYQVNEKSSKRWSSGFHTIISHGDCKDVLCPPHVWDENGNLVYGGSDQLLTYFDISSAEVKAAGYASGDPDLIAKFNSGEDIYIYSAQLYLGTDGWEKLSKKQKKMWRKRFKTVFLGVLYGLGKNSLAERLDASLEEADNIIQSLYKSFPQLRTYVDYQGQFPLEHDGYINTMLGDRLRVREFYEYLPKAKTDREKTNLVARIKRLGVNLPIQGGTSSIMACGFMNNIRKSIEEKWKQPLQPIIVVHDSNTNYVPVEKMFEIRSFYDTNYTKYCSTIGPGIFLLFDLLAGYSYETAKEMKQIDNNTIEFSGDAYSILKIYDKLMNCKSINVSCDQTREWIEEQKMMIEDPVDRFIREGGCNMTKDISSITVRFHKE